MKKILLILAMFIITGITQYSKAQCDLVFNNLIIQPVSSQPYPNALGTQCKAVFDASFDITTNSGFKYLFFHSWLSVDYPSSPIFDCSGSTPAVDPGTAAQLGTTNLPDPGKSFLDIGFVGLKEALASVDLNTPTDITAYFATTYPHDNTVILTQPSNSPGLTAIVTKLPGNVLHFNFANITIYLNQPCGSSLQVMTDIWGSNSNANDPKAQCYICGIPQFLNDPRISGFKNCDQPIRKYALGLDMLQQFDVTVTYKVYLDVNGDGDLDIPGDQLAFTSGPIVLNSGNNWHYDTGPFPIALPSPYSDTQPWSEMGYLIFVEGALLSNSVVKLFPHPLGCASLPVDFKSFTAVRNRSIVVLKWETAIELNSDGFAIERNINGSWQQVAYIPSQAPGGNSNDPLTYTLNDPNGIKGISQYRVKQIDQDGKFKYSVIRAVRGEGQLGKTIIFPNPSHDGKVTIVFEDAAVPRNVSLIDMTGRVIRQWKGVMNNNLQIDNLVPGVFSVRIVVPETGEQIVERIVVSKR